MAAAKGALPAAVVSPAAAEPSNNAIVKPRAKLSYKDQRELEMLPGRIDALEAEQVELTASSSDAAFYQNDAASIQAVMDRLAAIGEELNTAYARWAELDG